MHFILWLLLLFPLIEIVRNDLFENLIHREVIFADTIEDLIDGRLTLYSDEYKKGDWNNPDFYGSFENNTFKHNFREFTKKLKTLESEFKRYENFTKDELIDLLPQYVSILKKPQQIQKLFDGIAIIQDEAWMQTLTTIASRFAPIHKGQSYVSLLITPLCYGCNFKFGEEAEELSV